jgi:predicted MFS family arabinose efflux permease
VRRATGRPRALGWLLVAEAISFTGSRVSFLAVPWLVLATTGSAARTGLVAFAEMLPYVLASALGGPVIDRRGARRMSIGADVASAAAISLVPVLHWLDLLAFGGLVGVIAVAGALRGVGDIAKRALLPAAVEASQADLTRANGLHDGVDRSSLLVGAVVGGVLIAWLGPADVLMVDGLSFGLAAVIVAAGVRLRPTPATAPGSPTGTPPVTEARPGEVPQPYAAAFRAGLDHLRRDRLIVGMAVMVALTNLLDQAHQAVFVPVWVQESVGSPRALGLVFGALGVGALVGNLVFAVLAPRLPRYATFSLCFLLGGGPHMIVMAATDSVAVMMAVMFASGVLCAAINPILSAVMYERVPPDLRARVLGLTRALSWVGIPLGGLLGGLAAEGLGLVPSLLLTGGLYVTISLVPLVRPGWRREIERPRRPPRRAAVPSLARA